MGKRSWLDRIFGAKSEMVEAEGEDEDEQLIEEFNEVLDTFEREAESLFEDDEPHPQIKPIDVATPEYDVGEVTVDAILDDEEMSNFTNENEVEIVDVAELDDPLEVAEVLGDIPTTVEFD